MLLTGGRLLRFLFLLAHRLTLLVLLLVALLRRLVCPILVLPEPIGMTSLHPIWILVIPPLSVMPYVLLVVVAITVAPALFPPTIAALARARHAPIDVAVSA